MARFDGKVAAVTGGASGIGEATVRRFVAEGAKVGFADRDEERGRAIAHELQSAGHSVVFHQVSVQHEEEAMAFVRATAEHFGRLDILVNNAGIRLYQTVPEASEASWDQILGVNLKGYAFCAKAAIPLLSATGGGAIVNVASVRSITAGPRSVQYDTTKAAILGLTRSMARDHAAEGVRVNAVGPGPIYTRFHEQRARDSGKPEAEFIHEFGEGTLLGRPGRPEEIASGILFLASEDASFVTGTCLFIDGGQTAI